MKKGSFLSGKTLGAANEPTADAIRELNKQLVQQVAEPMAEAKLEAKKEPLPALAKKEKAVKKPGQKDASKPVVVTSEKSEIRNPKSEIVKERTVRITVDLPESLHEQLKFYTFRRKTSIKDLFLAQIEQLVAGEK